MNMGIKVSSRILFGADERLTLTVPAASEDDGGVRGRKPGEQISMLETLYRWYTYHALELQVSRI